MTMINVLSGTVYTPQGLFVSGQNVNIPAADAAHIVSLGVGVLAPGAAQSVGSLANFPSRGEQNLGAFPQGSITFSGQPLTGSSISLGGTSVGFVTSGAVGNQVNIGGNLAATLTALAAFLNASVDPGISLATYSVSGSILVVTSPGLPFAISASAASVSVASNAITQNAGP